MSAKSHLPLCSAIALALSLSACDNSQETTSEPTLIRPVKLITVSAAEATDVSRFPAVIDADKLSELSLQVGGMLLEFPVNEAQRLEPGDLIARLDQRDFKSAVDSAKAQYRSAEQEYQRAVRLAEEDAIARNVLEQRKTQYDVGKVQLEQAEKALADSVLRAPFKGIIAQTLVKKLQTVSPGQEVVKLMDTETLAATIDLPASFLVNVADPESESDRRRAFVILDAAPDRLIEATYKEALLLADTASQTYAITFTFRPPEDLLILPGMNATMELRLENEVQTARVAVPLDAVSGDGENNHVWTVDEDTMTVSRRAVTIEQRVGETVVVTEGLEVGDMIVGAGAAYLSEGMKIKEWK